MASAFLTKRGDYWYVVTVDKHPETGKERRRARSTGKKTKREAKPALERALKAIQARQRLEDNPTVADWLEHWITTQLQQSMDSGEMAESTFYSYQENCRLKIAPRIGKMRLAEVRPTDLDAMWADIRERGGPRGGPLSPRSVWYAHAILHRALKVACEKQVLASNPCDLAKPPRPRQKEQAFLSPVDALRLIEANDDDPWLDFVTLALHTGLRNGELLALAWADIDLDAPSIRVRAARKRRPFRKGVVDGDVKTEESRRTLPLDPEAVACLRRLRVQQQKESLACKRPVPDRPFCHWFRGTWAGWSPSTPADNVTRMYVKAGLPVPENPVHALRHTFGTLLAAKNVHPKVAQRLLGHADVTTTLKIYTHVLDEQAVAAVANVADLLKPSDPKPTDTRRRRRNAR